MVANAAGAELQSERELPRRRDRFEEAAVVGDDDEGAVVAAERLLELLDRLEVEVVGRLVEDEQVHPARLELGQVRSRPLARRERRARPADVLRAEPELRQQRSGVDRDGARPLA